MREIETERLHLVALKDLEYGNKRVTLWHDITEQRYAVAVLDLEGDLRRSSGSVFPTLEAADSAYEAWLTILRLRKLKKRGK